MNNVKFTDNSAEVESALSAATEKALEIIGLKAEGYAKLLCPVGDTGNLKNSITHAQMDENTEVIGTNVEYAPYVEMGTQRSKAQPYLKPAAEDHLDEYKAIVESTLKNA